MPYCKKCGMELEPDAKFCPSCGTPSSVKTLKASKKPRARPKAPQKIRRTDAIIASVVTAAVIIVVFAIYIGSKDGEEGGLGGAGAPPNAMLNVTAEDSADIDLTIEHVGGDDLVWTDLTLKVGDTSAALTTIDPGDYGVSGTFSVGDVVTIANTGVSSTDDVITVYLIHDPSNQKIFSSTTVGVD